MRHEFHESRRTAPPARLSSCVLSQKTGQPPGSFLRRDRFLSPDACLVVRLAETDVRGLAAVELEFYFELCFHAVPGINGYRCNLDDRISAWIAAGGFEVNKNKGGDCGFHSPGCHAPGSYSNHSRKLGVGRGASRWPDSSIVRLTCLSCCSVGQSLGQRAALERSSGER